MSYSPRGETNLMAMQLAIKHLVLGGGRVQTESKCGCGVNRERNESQGEISKEELSCFLATREEKVALSLHLLTHPPTC